MGLPESVFLPIHDKFLIELVVEFDHLEYRHQAHYGTDQVLIPRTGLPIEI